MRVGSRLLSSPYITGSLGVLVIFLGFSYWTTDVQIKILTKKLEELNIDLKAESKLVTETESRYMKLQEDHNKLHSKLELLEEKNIQKARKIQELEESNAAMNQEMQSNQVLAGKSSDQTQLEEQNKQLQDTVNELRNQIEELENQLEEQELKSKNLQGELSEILEQHPHAPIERQRHGQRKAVGSLGPGQLPDVNPAAVNVVKKDTLGMTFHQDKNGRYLPIIVPGDPNAPRAKPRLSV
eukprot:TRINITY_DN5435_c1_g2_i11.p1 TRINITY_DN5435_c1_g2~~TRINITY_DN5435_c1_g2_i11.p1  ORF type:complete len:240 (-),score=43.55 TRINITY_DN5435_c1_g2_i11:73-792(-)